MQELFEVFLARRIYPFRYTTGISELSAIPHGRAESITRDDPNHKMSRESMQDYLKFNVL